MKRLLRASPSLLVLAAALNILPRTVQGDEKTERRKSSEHIAKEIRRLQLHKIYVSDFLDTSGARTDKGCYFASVFSTNLEEDSKGFEVLNRIEAQKFLDTTGISASDLQKAEVPSKLSALSGIDAILLGTLVLSKDIATLDFSLRDASSGKELYHTAYKEKLTPGFAGYFPATTDQTGRLFYFPGLDGLSLPKCIHCPDPPYTDHDRIQRIEGSIALSALLTARGSIEEIWVIHSVEPGLDERAINTARAWKMNRVRDAAGNAVSVRLPIEITFRLF
jgi:TonB family protein